MEDEKWGESAEVLADNTKTRRQARDEECEKQGEEERKGRDLRLASVYDRFEINETRNYWRAEFWCTTAF